MSRALLIIDMSKDFIYEDGALTCGQAGIDIVSYCRDVVSEFASHGDLVFDARDLHDPEDYEIRAGLFPPHNMRDTDGQHLIDELSGVLENYPSVWIQIPKKHYNAGYKTELFDLIRQHKVTELHLIGVCTDICVRYTLNGLYEFRANDWPELRLVIHRQGVASFNEQGHTDSLAHFETALGASVV